MAAVAAARLLAVTDAATAIAFEAVTANAATSSTAMNKFATGL